MRNNIKFQSDFNALKKYPSRGNSLKIWVNAQCRWRMVNGDIVELNFSERGFYDARRRLEASYEALNVTQGKVKMSEKEHNFCNNVGRYRQPLTLTIIKKSIFSKKINKTFITKQMASNLDCPGERCFV